MTTDNAPSHFSGKLLSKQFVTSYFYIIPAFVAVLLCSVNLRYDKVLKQVATANKKVAARSPCTRQRGWVSLTEKEITGTVCPIIYYFQKKMSMSMPYLVAKL